MQTKAEDRLAPVVKRLALVFALLVTTLLPAGYFGVQYASLIEHTDTTARIKADAINALVARNPELWMYQLQRLEELLPQYPMRLDHERITVRNLAGDALVTAGAAPQAPLLLRTAAIQDSGRVVGQVDIAHSYRDVLIGTLAAALLGLLLGVAVFATLVVLPLRALRRVTGALIQEKAALAESEARFRSLTEMSSDFYWESDAEHRLTQRSASKSEAAGSVFHLASPIGQHRWDIPYISPDQSGWLKHRAMLEAHLPFRDFEISRLAADGAEHHISISGDPVFDGSGEFKGYRGVGTDITERKLAEANLRVAATAFEAQEGMFVTDANNVILQVNRAFTEITSYTAEEAVGQTPRLLRSGRHDAGFYRALWDSIAACGNWKGEIWNRRKNGEVYPEWLTITAVKDGAGAITNYVATLIDITGRKAAEDEIKNLAFYDTLTQLPNRRLLMDRLQQALASSERSRRRAALLFIDLDHFKTLNDTLGHDKGDLLLQQVAQRLSACVRAADTVARLGGDEFVVMLEDLSEGAEKATAQARAIAEKILATFSQPYLLAGHPYQSSGSIGIAPFCGHDQTATVLLKQADIAMYQAKAAGRNGLRFFEPDMQTAVSAAAQADEAHQASSKSAPPA